ncbi:DEAD/DEAH box helicase family protein [Peredibacter starrii]|uniref:DEAD/DEAH box helicase family protein n=1 Tax=Peredibacter starrii TaxID=28202 RepID=A0AAX4HTB4_9BACT|nr:DEAD/DEAH box helicase family protein [Peredibacter starrii]WPU66527.1 DEAD/DEAH box helicase family protein [Peredibacter starrii]
MKSEALELYVYTTKSHEVSGLIKVGHSLRGRHKERIKEQFGTSNPEQPIIKWVQELPGGFRDIDIHSQLIKNGISRVEGGPGKEWFIATLDDVKRAYNQLVNGSKRLENFKPRQEQLEAVEKAKKWFVKDYPKEVLESATHQDRFLLNAKMRFGKCFTGIHIAKAIKARKTIVVTYKPEVISEWMESANNHVDFEGWMGIRAKKKNGVFNEPCLSVDGDFPDTSGPIVLCVSLQDLSIDQDGETKRRLEKVIKSKWDLIIFDEVHFGSRTERAKYIIDKITDLNITYRLDLSGTPFRLIQQDDFCSQQVFTYSYLDEKKNKDFEIFGDLHGTKEKIYRQMPNLDISTIEITEDDICEQTESFITDDLDFSLNELFKAKKNGFEHEDAVDHFLDGLVKRDHDAKAISVYGKLGEQLGLPPIRHSVWWLNRVDSVAALASKLRKHPYFSRFEIINASGSETGNEDDETLVAKDKATIEEKIRAVNNDPKKLGTITLTVRRFLTGVTIKEWESILVLNDVKSAESYYQAIFRVQSAWVDRDTKKVLKPQAWVFDFAISRCLRITYEYADALADQLDQQDSFAERYTVNKDNLVQTMTGLCESLNIKRFYEGRLSSDQTTARDIFDALNLEGSRISLAKRITSDALVNFTSLKLLEENPRLFEVLKKVKGYRTQEVGSIEDFVQIGLDADKLKEKKRKNDITEEEIEENNKDFVEDEKDKEKQTRKKWFATQIKRLAICMADFVYMTQFREHNIDHVIQTKDSEFFGVVTGISKEDFSELCEFEFINKSSLNRIVREFRCQEESSLKPEEYILEQLRAIHVKESA